MIDSKVKSYSVALNQINTLQNHFSKPSTCHMFPVNSWELMGQHESGVKICLNIKCEMMAMSAEISTLENKLTDKELAYDDIIQSLLKTEIGKAHNRSNTQGPDILSHIDAVIIIQTMEQELQQYAVLDEIPFGASEPYHEVSELHRRVAELEMQLDFERSHKRDLQLACLSFCAGMTANIQRDITGGGK